MNNTIWKFLLDLSGYQEIDMPVDAEILTVKEQQDVPVLWAIVDPTKTIETRLFEIIPTGGQLTGEVLNKKYIGTYHLSRGALVYHLFEIISK